jgi:hypothetical protein
VGGGATGATGAAAGAAGGFKSLGRRAIQSRWHPSFSRPLRSSNPVPHRHPTGSSPSRSLFTYDGGTRSRAREQSFSPSHAA